MTDADQRAGQAARRTPLPAAERRAVVSAAAGIGVYAAAFGATFGAVATGSGLSLAPVLLLSLVMFTGASQFALVAVVAAGGSAAAAVAAALLLGLRNAFYGVPVSRLLRPTGWRRPVAAHFVIDETTAMAAAQDGPGAGRFAFWATGTTLFAAWAAGTVAGALLGQAVDTAALGLDAAAPAVFLALLWPHLSRPRGRIVAAAGAVVAAALLPVAPAGVPVLAAAGVAAAGGLLPGPGPRSRAGAA